MAFVNAGNTSVCKDDVCSLPSQTCSPEEGLLLVSTSTSLTQILPNSNELTSPYFTFECETFNSAQSTGYISNI